MVSDDASAKVYFRDKTGKLLLALSFTAHDPEPTFAGAESGHCGPGKVDIAPLWASAISDRGGFQWSPPVIGSSARFPASVSAPQRKTDGSSKPGTRRHLFPLRPAFDCFRKPGKARRGGAQCFVFCGIDVMGIVADQSPASRVLGIPAKLFEAKRTIQTHEYVDTSKPIGIFETGQYRRAARLSLLP